MVLSVRTWDRSGWPGSLQQPHPAVPYASLPRPAWEPVWLFAPLLPLGACPEHLPLVSPRSSAGLFVTPTDPTPALSCSLHSFLSPPCTDGPQSQPLALHLARQNQPNSRSSLAEEAFPSPVHPPALPTVCSRVNSSMLAVRDHNAQLSKGGLCPCIVSSLLSCVYRKPRCQHLRIPFACAVCFKLFFRI